MRQILFALLLNASLCLAADQREDFSVAAYLGLAVDSFAAPAYRNAVYGNPLENGAKRERIVGGVHFEYHLSGSASVDHQRQLWVYGETAHGVRSAELDCSNPETRPPLCALSMTGAEAGKQLIFLLRNASSLEAHAGLRYEFLPLQPKGAHPARLYFKAQAGFLSLPSGAGDVFDVHRISLGAVTTAGPFQGSYFEAGFGRDDVFLTHRYRRAVMDGFLTWSSPTMRAQGMSAFLEMRVSSDLSGGADSVQSFLGLTFDLGRMLGN